MVDIITLRKRSRRYSVLCTLLLTGSVLLILLLILLHTPNPPYPEGGGGTGDGIELNLGYSDAGMGANPQELSVSADKPVPATEQADDEKILTQDVEDAPAVNQPEKVQKTKPFIKKDIKKTVKPTKKVPEKVQTVNVKALYPARRTTTSADGDQNVAGDQGVQNGSLGAKAFGGKSGQGGTGGGTGGGNGTGTGSGTGSGISYSLAGRVPQSFPAPEYKQQVEGSVVVEVTVDKEGKVTQAIPGVKGSTTLDDNLLEAARRAAMKASFDRKPDAPAFQKGTITYKFRLQ
jgi:TonB family protein